MKIDIFPNLGTFHNRNQFLRSPQLLKLVRACCLLLGGHSSDILLLLDRDLNRSKVLAKNRLLFYQSGFESISILNQIAAEALGSKIT